jgi:hypothetical protein
VDGGNIGALVIVSRGRFKGRQGAIRGATESSYTVELSQSQQKHVVVPIADVEIVSGKDGEGFARRVLKGGGGALLPGGAGSGASGAAAADGGKTPLFGGLGGATPAYGGYAGAGAGEAFGSRVRCHVRWRAAPPPPTRTCHPSRARADTTRAHLAFSLLTPLPLSTLALHTHPHAHARSTTTTTTFLFSDTLWRRRAHANVWRRGWEDARGWWL